MALDEGDINMRIRFERILLGLVTACVCATGFSSTQPDAGQALSPGIAGDKGVFFVVTTDWFEGVGGSASVTQEPLLLAEQTKVYVCSIKANGKFKTQHLPEETALWLVAKRPNNWKLGKCDDVVSPS